MKYYFAINKSGTTYVIVETKIENVSKWIKDLDYIYKLLADTFNKCDVLISMEQIKYYFCKTPKKDYIIVALSIKNAYNYL